MNIKFIFQKIYFSPKEWNELRLFLKTLNMKCFLLSKNFFLTNFNKLKNSLIGECIIIEYNNNSINNIINNINELLSIINNKYNNKLYLIYILLNNSLILKKQQLESYKKYINHSINNNNNYNYSINHLFFYNFLKFLTLKNSSVLLSLSLLLKNKNDLIQKNFKIYY